MSQLDDIKLADCFSSGVILRQGSTHSRSSAALGVSAAELDKEKGIRHVEGALGDSHLSAYFGLNCF